MYLKSIEVHGFKSFANKIVFDFHNGITGIVGPNGSGKSNVADAVRWVLGEQRIKQLRGSSMQDVIFAGTELRKPLSYASVAITMDNSDGQLPIDYKEVTVARRLYRSGESEYLLNGSVCRLKDINELFYDTGIGKEGYSIIGQGQIDKILSGKPEERRELFDEAAGIVKFKRRKEAAQKKLENEKQYLVRTNDILAELEKRVGPLERQAETAKTYLKKKEELKTCDINMFLLELERLKTLLNELSGKLEIASAQYQDATAQYDETKIQYEEIERKLDEIDQAIEESNTLFNEKNVLKEQLEGRLNVLREQMNTVRLNEEHFAERLHDLEQNQVKSTQQLEANQQELDQNENELQKIMDEQNEKSQKLHEVQEQIRQLTEKIDVNKQLVIDLLNNRVTISAEKERFETMLEQLQIRKSEVDQRFIVLQSGQKKQAVLVEERKASLEKIGEEIRAIIKECDELDAQIEEVRGKIVEQNEKFSKEQAQYHKDRSKLDSLTNLSERYEGYGNSIRRVMERKNEVKGIVGVVADIIHIEQKYETAIETALGGSIQNIVTRDEQTAKQMIEYLKKNKYGRATFLPLTSIRPSADAKEMEATKEKGAIAIASQLVECSEDVRRVAEFLLGRILVVDHMDHAIQIAKKYKYGIRIVTLDGELLSPGGSMSGGMFKNASNLLGRKRELEELTALVKQERGAMDDTQNRIAAYKSEREVLRQKAEDSKKHLQELFLKQNTEKLNWNQAIHQESTLKEEFEELQEERSKIDGQIVQVKEEAARIEAEISDSSGSHQGLEKQIEEDQNSLAELRKSENTYVQAAVDLQMSRSGLAQKKEFLQQTRKQVLVQLEDFKQEYQMLVRGKEASVEDIQSKQTQASELSDSIVNAEKEAQELQAKLVEMRQTRERLTSENRSFFAKREELAEKVNMLDKEMYRLNSQKERLEGDREAQINYMWDEYELTYSSANDLRNPEYTSLPELKRRGKEIREEIRNLGTVNVSAIEEYKETSERYEFLKAQRDDLVEAEETLLGIITELDNGMRKQFKEKFELIRVEFDKAFKELFGGGKGTIELDEAEDILEAGIRIISQPPGKKLQNMMQLSGGEKALTAIALLFAIQNLKPSPFCLLDEIEAALDDSNVGRFANYLHKLTKNTQFIVITHRRGTMTAADRLYGITMQEKGVSTLVSVNLIEENLDD